MWKFIYIGVKKVIIILLVYEVLSIIEVKI